jgi:hypothetical protein
LLPAILGHRNRRPQTDSSPRSDIINDKSPVAEKCSSFTLPVDIGLDTLCAGPSAGRGGTLRCPRHQQPSGATSALLDVASAGAAHGRSPRLLLPHGACDSVAEKKLNRFRDDTSLQAQDGTASVQRHERASGNRPDDETRQARPALKLGCARALKKAYDSCGLLGHPSRRPRRPCRTPATFSAGLVHGGLDALPG